MGNVYLSVAGGNINLLDRDTGEIKIFDNFGKFKGNGLVSSLGASLLPVNCVSILSTGLKSCEIFVDGKVKDVDLPYLTVTRKIMDKMRAWQGIVFRLNHPEGIPHVIVVSHLDALTTKDVDSILQVDNLIWSNCN